MVERLLGPREDIKTDRDATRSKEKTDKRNQLDYSCLRL